MADLKESAITLLSSTAIADMTTDAPTIYSLYSAPTGKQALITRVVVHSNSASLAGCNDVNFGGGAAAATPVWMDAEAHLAGMTSASMYWSITADDAVQTLIDGDDATAANRTFAMGVVSGSTGSSTAVVDVFGYLIDS